MKEERKANIIFGKSGDGGITTIITLPVPWVAGLGRVEPLSSVLMFLFSKM